jgi:hypothetical protein
VLAASWVTLSPAGAKARVPANAEGPGEAAVEGAERSADQTIAPGVELQVLRMGSAELLDLFAERQARPLWLDLRSTHTREGGSPDRAAQWLSPRMDFALKFHLEPAQTLSADDARRRWRRVGGWLALLSATGVGAGVGLHRANEDLLLFGCGYGKAASSRCPRTWNSRELGMASVVGGALLGASALALSFGGTSQSRDMPLRRRARVELTPRSVTFKVQF